MVAVLGPSGIDRDQPGLAAGGSPSRWRSLIAVLFGTLSGALAVRTAGIYTIMITLAIAAAFFYFTRQNYAIFNGFNGFSGVRPPRAFGVDWRAPGAVLLPRPVSARRASYFAVLYVSRAPFGLALQGIRDNARRMAALGFNVTAHRDRGLRLRRRHRRGRRRAPRLAERPDLARHRRDRAGDRHPGDRRGGRDRAPDRPVHRRPDLRACCAPSRSTCWSRSASTAQRFQLLIGLGFLAVVLFSPDGVIGLWARWRERLPRRARRACGPARPERWRGRGGCGRAGVRTAVAERLSAAGAANALELRGVTRMFGALAALTDVTLSVRPGERRAVLGSNGAGKTTLFNCITGDFPPTSGTIRFFGEDVTDFPAARAHPPRPAAHLPDLAAVRRPLRPRQRLSRLPRRLARPLLAAAPAPGRRARRSRPRTWSRPST